MSESPVHLRGTEGTPTLQRLFGFIFFFNLDKSILPTLHGEDGFIAGHGVYADPSSEANDTIRDRATHGKVSCFFVYVVSSFLCFLFFFTSRLYNRFELQNVFGFFSSVLKSGCHSD